MAHTTDVKQALILLAKAREWVEKVAPREQLVAAGGYFDELEELIDPRGDLTSQATFEATGSTKKKGR